MEKEIDPSIFLGLNFVIKSSLRLGIHVVGTVRKM